MRKLGSISWAAAGLALAAAAPSHGELICADSADVGQDAAARFFHRAGRLTTGQVIVSGGMRLQPVPPSLVSLATLSFYDTAAQTFSTSFMPTGGGGPTTPTLATPRSSHAQTTLPDGRVLITGGRTGASGTNPGTPVASCEIFNPVTGGVSAGPAMSVARADHSATSIADGRVVVAGGATWQVFNPVTNLWSTAFSLQRSRLAHAAVLLPDHAGPGMDGVLLIGGAGSGPTTLEVLEPDAGASTLSTQTLAVGVDDLAAAVLADGRVLVVGGQNLATGDTIDDAYLYDPFADTLAAAAAPPARAAGISDHQMLTIGRFALVFGGEQQVAGVDTELNYAAAFDADAEAWMILPAMNHEHDDYPALLLPGERVLLIGGGIPFLGQELPSAFVEEYSFAAAAPGDLDGDGIVTGLDIGPFVGVLTAPEDATPHALCAADVDGSLSIDANDAVSLTALLTTP